MTTSSTESIDPDFDRMRGESVDRITEVRSSILAAPESHDGAWMLVRIRTAQGIEGLGECGLFYRSHVTAAAVKQLIDNYFGPIVIGQPVRNISRLWEQMYNACVDIYDRRGLAIHAVSSIDMAVTDAALA